MVSEIKGEEEEVGCLFIYILLRFYANCYANETFVCLSLIFYTLADGCANNMSNMLRYLADHLFKFGYEYCPAVSMPDHGLYHPKFDGGADETKSYLQDCFDNSGKPTVAIIFYRCHYLSGNRAFVDALIDELEVLGVNAIGLFTETLRAHEPIDNVNGHAVERFPTALTFLLDESTGKCMVDVLISSMAFAMGEVNPDVSRS